MHAKFIQITTTPIAGGLQHVLALDENGAVWSAQVTITGQLRDGWKLVSPAF
ncbi:hypothetical protein [Schauerella aestuarii]|uniref:hypothetical protein n=1 Tax=Schauerella aestuarii TaxID=2511204 RepID=UPI00136D27C7|nr:hypothetical protein [Achromobacter aestuarii]